MEQDLEAEKARLWVGATAVLVSAMMPLVLKAIEHRWR